MTRVLCFEKSHKQTSRFRDFTLTRVVRVSHVENIVTVYVMVKGLFDQVLWFVSRQLRHPVNARRRQELFYLFFFATDSKRNVYFSFGGQVLLQRSSAYLASRNMSFKSKLARNMNMFECNLISVIACGGNEWPTATKPTVAISPVNFLNTFR